MRQVSKALTMAAAVAGAGLLAAAPASAAPFWQPVSTTSNWHCGSTEKHAGSNNVLFQTCIVVSDSNTYAQAVLVVRNNASAAVNIEGSLTTNFGGGADCNFSKLNPGLVTGCFGPTIKVGSASPIYAYSDLKMNGISDRSTSITLV
ncbi:hypothetical protein ACLQ2D_33370 [Streptomyces sp. DT199]|uniref:hypothetical protein n=1 Tax=Streptomyces TaxID=1883 RepID=UPI0004C9990F|nr:hypothetical protein [Streptomyces sp. NRRL S-146]